jgi:hypothetical protein
MTTDRGRFQALTRLVGLQDAGGFTLPRELLDAAALPSRVGDLALPELPAYRIEQAADDVLSDLLADRPADLDGYAQRLADLAAARERYGLAQTIAANALEQAQSVAVNAAADMADRIITTCLRPAFEALQQDIAGHAKALDGHPLDDRSLITAPAKVRTAWSELRVHADQYGTLREARAAMNTAGLRVPEHDTGGEFATFQHPHRITGHTPGSTARAPRPEMPEDPVMRMLWLVGPAARGVPWLPTTREQDSAYLAVYGEGQAMRRTAAALAVATGARGSSATLRGSLPPEAA